MVDGDDPVYLKFWAKRRFSINIRS